MPQPSASAEGSANAPIAGCRSNGIVPVGHHRRRAVGEGRENTTGDCTVKEIVRIEMRVMVSRILKKCGYPPELGEKATRTVWSGAAG